MAFKAAPPAGLNHRGMGLEHYNRHRPAVVSPTRGCIEVMRWLRGHVTSVRCNLNWVRADTTTDRNCFARLIRASIGLRVAESSGSHRLEPTEPSARSWQRPRALSRRGPGSSQRGPRVSSCAPRPPSSRAAAPRRPDRGTGGIAPRGRCLGYPVGGIGPPGASTTGSSAVVTLVSRPFVPLPLGLAARTRGAVRAAYLSTHPSRETTSPGPFVYSPCSQVDKGEPDSVEVCFFRVTRET